MVAKYVLAMLGTIFLVLAITRLIRGGGASHPQTRTWLLVGIIFAAVSAWLFYRQG